MPLENYEYNQENKSNKPNGSYDTYKGYNPLTSGETSISEKDKREAEELIDYIGDDEGFNKFFGRGSDREKYLIKDTTNLNSPKMSNNDIQKFENLRNILIPHEDIQNDDRIFIAAVQVYLNIIGSSHTGIFLKQDGILGDETKDAIRNFQRSVGLISDGIPGPDTINKLLKSVEYVRKNNNPNLSEENNPIIGIRIVNSSL